MKVVAFNGSPRKGGNTEHLIRMVFEELEKAGVETELVQVGGKKVQGCLACGKCFEVKGTECANGSDPVNEWIQKMMEADGVIIGSPTYFSNVTTEVKALIDRAGLVAMSNPAILRRKVGAAVVAVRRVGAANVFDALNKFFLHSQMIVPGAEGWNHGMGLQHGEVNDDPEGNATMRTLAENMAWLLKKLK